MLHQCRVKEHFPGARIVKRNFCTWYSFSGHRWFVQDMSSGLWSNNNWSDFNIFRYHFKCYRFRPIGLQPMNRLNSREAKIPVKERHTWNSFPSPIGIGCCSCKQYGSRICLIQFDFSSGICSACNHWFARYNSTRSRSVNDRLTQNMEWDGNGPIGYQTVNYLNNGKVKIPIKERCTGDDFPLPSGIGDCSCKQYGSRICLIQFNLSSKVCSTCHHWLASYKIARSR